MSSRNEKIAKIRAFFLEKDRDGLRFWEREISLRRGSAKANQKYLGTLCRQMAFMLGAGISIKQIILILSEGKGNPLKSALVRVHENIINGESLSSALEMTGVFPKFMCKMCRVGEKSDDLPKIMNLLANYYEDMSNNMNEIKAALMYPAIVGVMMIAMIFVAVLFVLPNYAMLFEDSDAALPFLTQALLNISDALMTYWYLILPGVMLIIIAFMLFFRMELGQRISGYIKLNMPPISTIYRQVVNLHIIQTLAILTHSAIYLPEAVLAVSEIVDNRRIEVDLRNIARKLQEGEIFSRLIGKLPYIDPIATNMARVGEETGDMAEVLEKAADYSRYQFAQMSKRINKLIEPIITVVVGLIMGIIMLAIILPSFAMTELVG
ncbi:MAG: type II secretion system F family protein [Turicibacter sp.]|nr:type II secretion system F family protein [Turicibacter sp.]